MPAGLNDVTFAAYDAAEIEREVIARYEEITGRTLARADPVRLFLESVAYVIAHQRYLIDFTGKQNLLRYAGGNYLEHLAALVGVTRLPAAAAKTTLRFTLSAARESVTIIPKGIRAGAGRVYFATSEALVINAGELSGEVVAECVTPGADGNGFKPGEISRVVDPFAYQVAVTNITESIGGADVESDENLRERVYLAPESFSVAGPVGAYTFWARTAHQDISDVAVWGPPDLDPGYVELYPLMRGGELPGQEILDAVLDVCNADDVRPLTDHLSAKKPVAVYYTVDVTYWLSKEVVALTDARKKTVEDSVQDWREWQRVKLGRDINPSELIKRMVEAGAKRVTVTQPEFKILKANEIALLSTEPDALKIICGGIEDD